MTDSCNRWPKYLLKRACLSQPENCRNLIYKNSTPVVSFGNPVRAVVATIGINPSDEEFRKERGLIRLEPGETIDESRGLEIVEGCAKYFESDGNPYDWFLPLDLILRAGARASYYVDSRTDARYLDLACHLDIFQWATFPTWGGIKKKSDKDAIRGDEQSREFLIEQLRQGHYRLVVGNGIEVIRWICNAKERLGLAEWIDVTPSDLPIKLWKGNCGDTLFLAWDCYVKNDPQHIPLLAQFVAEQYDSFLNERRKT